MPDTDLVVSAAVGLASGAGLAAIKYSLDQRAKVHEDLWTRRLEAYRSVWALTSQFSRWPRQAPTCRDVRRLQELLRQWYYREGGILMSARARKRYDYVQRSLLATCGEHGEEPLVGTVYDQIMEVMSKYRTQLTSDLESRRKRSIVWSIADRRAFVQENRKLDGVLAALEAAREPSPVKKG